MGRVFLSGVTGRSTTVSGRRDVNREVECGLTLKDKVTLVSGSEIEYKALVFS